MRQDENCTGVQWNRLLCLAAGIAFCLLLSVKSADVCLTNIGMLSGTVLSSDVCLRILPNGTVLSILVLITISDLRNRVIPNRCIAALLWVWLLRNAGNSLFKTGEASDFLIYVCSSVQRGCGAAALAGCVTAAARTASRFLHKRVLGGGDIKFLFAAGLFLGFQKGLYMLFTACLLSFSGVILKSMQESRCRKPFAGSAEFPFGPALSIAFAGLLLGGSV